MKTLYKLAGVTLVLAGLGSMAARAEMTNAGKEAAIKAGEVMFQHRCRSCHSEDLSHPSYGPPLKNIFGRKAGTVPGFNYSEALQASGIVWDEDQLRAWINDNKSVMPGTRMRHVGVVDLTEQNFLLSYLQHISE